MKQAADTSGSITNSAALYGCGSPSTMNCMSAANSSQYRMRVSARRGRTEHSSRPAFRLSAAVPTPVSALPTENTTRDGMNAGPARITSTQPSAATTPPPITNHGRCAIAATSAVDNGAITSNVHACATVDAKNMSDTTEAVASTPSTHTELL